MTTVAASAAAPPAGAIPLLLGVTGHRNLRDEDRPVLLARVREVLDGLSRDYPHTPLVLLSPLAEGADRLVARVALDAGVRLQVPLPVPRESYMADFAGPASRDEFAALADRAEAVFVVADGQAAAPAIGPDRDEQYRLVGEYVAEHCQILLALWDGVPSEKVGGTAHIIHWRLTVLPLETATGLHPPDPVRSGPVYQIITPRTGDPPPPDAFAVVHRLPEGRGQYPVPEQAYRDMYREIEEFNAVAAGMDAAEVEAATQSRRDLFPDGEADRLPAGLQFTRECFGLADALAVRFSRGTLGTLTAICWLVFLAVVAYEAVGEYYKPLGLVLYPVILGAAYLVFRRAKENQFQERYHDYRALAEGLRVQFFWRLAGLGLPVEEHYLRQQRRELNWVRTALRVCWSLQGGRLATADPVTADEERRRLRLTLTHWVENQHNFFGGRAPGERTRQHRYEWAIAACLAAGITLSVVVGLVLILADVVTPDEKPKEHSLAQGGLLLATSLPLVVAAMLHTYRAASALGSHVKQYEVLALLFANAHDRLKALGHGPAPADVRALIQELGKEALIENGDWVLLNRDRPLEVPTGR